MFVLINCFFRSPATAPHAQAKLFCLLGFTWYKPINYLLIILIFTTQQATFHSQQFYHEVNGTSFDYINKVLFNVLQ